MSGRVGSITTGIITDGLVFNMDTANRASYVPFSSSSKDTINLLSGSLYNNTAFSGSHSTPASPSSWYFDKIDDYIAVELNSDYNVGDYTIQFWINSTSDAAGNIIFSGFNGFQVGVNWGQVTFHRSGWPDLSIGAGTSDNGNWRQFAFTGNRTTGVLKSYKTGSYTTTVTNAAWGDNTRYIKYFGQQYTAGSFYGGLLANFQMYDRVLPDSEILYNYNALKSRFT